jgi:hypothetical protein
MAESARLKAIIRKVAAGKAAPSEANVLIQKMKAGPEKDMANLALSQAKAAANAGKGGAAAGGGLGGLIPDLAQERLNKALSGRLGTTVKKYEQFTMAIQKLGAESAKGASQISQQLQLLQRRQTQLGISMTDTMKAMQSAMEGYAGVVTPGWEKDYTAVTKAISVYDKLGISSNQTITLFNTFGAVLGKSRAEVTKTSQTLNKFAQTTGQSYSQVWQDFNANQAQFMDILDSKDMTRQTLLFQVRARRMGLSVGGMMSNLEKFETLEGAQSAAGKINAVMGSLGGSFDAVKASSMDYPERMEYIAKSIQSVMGRIQQSGPRASRAYMKAMGDAFGMDSRTLRAMISYRPGAALPGEIAAGRGMIGALTTVETERAAKEVATIEERAKATQDAKEAFMLEIVPKALGLTSGEIINQIKMGAGRIDDALIQNGAALGEGMAKKFGEGMGAIFEKVYNSVGKEVAKGVRRGKASTLGNPYAE